jgi:probable rRNA maturation factor
VLEVEVFGCSLLRDGPSPQEVCELCLDTAHARGVSGGHLAVTFVDSHRIAALNGEHRQRPEPTDVLSFPIDGLDAHEPALPDTRALPDTLAIAPPRELGDVVICPQHTSDVREAVVHGVLHLLGMDHETDDGEMLTLQRALLSEERG